MGVKDKTAVESEGIPFSLRAFSSMNTRDARTAIKEDEFSWLENVMPIGHGNLAVVPGPAAAEASIPAPATTITYMKYFTLSGADYLFISVADGRMFKFDISSSTLTEFAGGLVFSAPHIDQWKSERILIIDPARGYYHYNGTTLTAIDVNMKGTTLAVYSGRVWIINGRTVSFTDANSYTSFAGAGGSYIETEGVLKKGIYAVEVTNNYLYLFGDSSVYVIGDVTVSGGLTYFSKVNLATNVGTIFKGGVATLNRMIGVVDSHGIYGLFGAQPQRISELLDGIYSNIDFTVAPCVALSKLFSIQCLFALFPAYNDNGTVRSIIFAFFNGKWFAVSTTGTLQYITHAQKGGKDVLYGTDGTNIFHLLWDVTVAVPIKIQTKLFDFQDVITTKQLTHFGVEALTSVTNQLFITVDNLFGTSIPIALQLVNILRWVNNSGDEITWINNLGQVVSWISAGTVLLHQDIQGGGKYVGFTLTGTCSKLTLTGLIGEYNLAERW